MLFLLLLTRAAFTIHMVIFSLYTLVALLINRDKLQVSLHTIQFLIPAPTIYSTSLHFSKVKKPISPPFFGLINRGMWISLSTSASLRLSGYFFTAETRCRREKEPPQTGTLKKGFSTTCSNVLFPYFCCPLKVGPTFSY